MNHENYPYWIPDTDKTISPKVEPPFFNPLGDRESLVRKNFRYNESLKSRIPFIGEMPDKETLELNVDFELRYQFQLGDNIWKQCSLREYEIFDEPYRRIVAIPYPVGVQQDKIKSIDSFLKKYKVDGNTKITLSLLIELLDKFSLSAPIENKTAISILSELVNLKIMKDEFGKSNHYETRKEQAWEKAKQFLQGYPVGVEKEQESEDDLRKFASDLSMSALLKDDNQGNLWCDVRYIFINDKNALQNLPKQFKISKL